MFNAFLVEIDQLPNLSHLSVKVDLEQKRQLAELFGEDEEREKARLLSISLYHAGDWLSSR